MNSDIKISVVVPAYRRPKFLEMLIKSYLLQDEKHSELCIIDDSGDNGSVESMIYVYLSKYPNIRYQKNNQNIGFCKNLIGAINMARGKYILVLGDDDILAARSALSRYVQVFEDDSDIGYVYSNQIQFDNDLNADYIYQHFIKSIKYDAGWSSISSIWLLSCFISGMGFRKSENLANLYPDDNILFPQVELVGKILLSQKSYAIAEYLVGSRAHNEQLGFKAVKGNDIKSTERHSVYELGMIYDRLINYAKVNKLDEVTKNFNKSIVNKFFENKHMTIFPGEKINTGNSKVISIFIQSVRNNPLVVFNAVYLFYFLTAIILPKSILLKLKEWKKKQYMSHYNEEKVLFSRFITEINNV